MGRQAMAPARASQPGRAEHAACPSQQPEGLVCAIRKDLERVPEDVAVKILRQSFCPSGPKPVTMPVPPVSIPDPLLTLPPALIACGLRACAASIDDEQTLDVRVRSPACVKMLVASLPTLPALSEIRLTVADDSVEEELYAAMLRAACAVPQLTLLSLRDDSVMDHHIITLAGAMLRAKQLRELRLDATPASVDVGLPFSFAFATLTSLTCVRFSHAEILANGSKMIRGRGMMISHIREMHFDRLFLTVEDLAAFFGGELFLPNVEVLQLGYDVSRYGVGAHDDIDVDFMANGCFIFPLLRDLSLRDYRSGATPGLAAAMLGRPAHCPHLSRVDLSYSLHRDDSADLGRLLAQMPHLVSLTLRMPSDDEGALAPDEYGPGLAVLTRLTHLDLSGSQLTGAAAVALADALGGLSALASLCISNAVLVGTLAGESTAAEDTLAHSLQKLAGMRDLRLENCFLSPNSLVVVLEGMPLLRVLWLRGTMLGVDGAHALACGLRLVPGLEVLHVGQSLLDPPGLRALAPGLAALGSLTQLNLSFCQMGREGAEELAGALCPEAVAGKRQRQSAASALVVLDVSYSGLGREGAAALLPALLKMQNLREVNVQQGERALSAGMLADLQAANTALYVGQ